MAGIGSIVVQFRAETDKAVRETKKFVRSLQGVDSAAKDTGASLKKGLKVGALAAAAGVAGLAVAAVDFAKAAYSDAQAARKLERTLKTVKGVTDAAADSAATWVDKMELLTTISDDELRVALGRLVLVTEDLTDAQKLTALAADASVGSGREFATVASAMAKAAGGNVSALKKLFPQLDAGPDKILTFEEAMDQLRDTYKGAAKDAADNDLFGRLATAWGQIKEAVGQAALPSFEEVSDWFSDPANIQSVQDWITKIGEWSTEVGETFRDKIVAFTDYLKSPEGQAALTSYGDALQSIADGFVAIGSGVDTAAGYLDDLLEAWNSLPAPLKAFAKFAIAPGASVYRGITDTSNPASLYEQMNPGASQRDGRRVSSADRSQVPAGINIVVNNGKQEPIEDTAALAIRIARRTKGD